jgi:NAD(P)-dependent dehydrogenase (short-subunit alcohol dehydrogenase family)
MARIRTLVVLGSGPGIGVSIASLWAQHGFENIALLARDAGRFQIDARSVSEAAAAVEKTVNVKMWTVDLNNST